MPDPDKPVGAQRKSRFIGELKIDELVKSQNLQKSSL